MKVGGLIVEAQQIWLIYAGAKDYYLGIPATSVYVSTKFALEGSSKRINILRT
jgi:hypothetical protein